MVRRIFLKTDFIFQMSVFSEGIYDYADRPPWLCEAPLFPVFLKNLPEKHEIVLLCRGYGF